MKEIGGYFGLELFGGAEFYPDLIPLNTGRNALLYLLKARKIKKLYIPYYLCDCVFDVCEKNGVAFEHYHVDRDFSPMFNKSLGEGEYLYIVNYYGWFDADAISGFKDKYKNIVCDNVQAFFQLPIKGVDTIYSCRKFFGVPDGAYLYTDVRLREDIETDCSADRMKHIIGRAEGRASDYYGDFQSGEEGLYGLDLRYMSALTHNILRAIDYNAVCKQRERNYAVLRQALEGKNKLESKTVVGPYCYPFYCDGGMDVKKRLAKKGIYVPTLWPDVQKLDANDYEKDYAANILPLPCDQRYTSEDMECIVQNIF